MDTLEKPEHFYFYVHLVLVVRILVMRTCR